jgi:hypothetical protein
VVIQLGGWARCSQLLTIKRALLQNKYVLQAWPDPFLPTKEWKRDMRFGMWNIRSLYRAGSLTAAARELARY